MKQGWEIKKLGDIANIRSGKSIDASLISDDSSRYPCFGGNGIRGYVENYRYDGCYPIIGRVGALCGNVHLAKGKFNATEHALIVETKRNDINVEWLTYNLISLKLRDVAKGVAQPVIAASEVSKIAISIPPIAEQEKIVAELDCLSGIIEKKKQQLKELDNLAQSIFYEMFGDPVENDKGWEVKKFGDVANSELGKMLDSKKNQGELYPYLCSANVQWNDVDCTQVKEMRFEEDELERYRVYKGDLLICEGGDTGRCAIWKSDNAIYYQNALHRVRFVDGLMLPIFCLYTMKCYKERGEIDKYSSGQTIKHLVKKVLLTIPLIVPPITLQQEFASKIESIEKQKELIAKSIRETETLFNSRMDYYFN